jgi:hypothetical protein
MFNLNEYQTVQERIDLFWSKYPEGRFKLKIVSMTDNQVVIKASVWTDKNDPHPATVDFAEERIGTSPVNKVSHVENCATSSLGRAISALGHEFSPKGKRPSREEMEKVERHNSRDYLAELDLVESVDDARSLYSAARSANAKDEILKAIEKKAKSLGSAE